MDPIIFIIIVLCGLVIGLLAGMFGIGGGTLIIPLLNVAVGLPMVVAASTSLLSIAPTAVSGTIRHWQQKTIQFKAGLLMGSMGALTSICGALLSEITPDLVLALLTVAVVIFSATRMFLPTRKSSRTTAERTQVESTQVESTHAEGTQAKSTQAKRSQVESTQAKKQERWLPLVCIGLFAGLIAGLVGVGGGFVIVPFCATYLGWEMKQAAGTSLLSITLIAIPGIITHAFLGQIEWLYGLALIVGTIPGAQVGAWVATKIPDRTLRVCFGILLCITGGLLLVNNIGVFQA